MPNSIYQMNRLHDYSRDGISFPLYQSEWITIYQLGNGGYITFEPDISDIETTRYFPTKHRFVDQFLERGG